MATYKVIQDVEAEDKLLGPLTLKQFIFAAVTAGFIFVAFITVTKVGTILAAIPFLPFIILTGALAAPLGKDQPTDVWLAARIRFLIKPRKRVWDQSGLKELVTINVPKRVEKYYSDGLSQQEVRSRLKALADTIDSRGWAVKNVDLNMAVQPAYAGEGYDRLIDPASLPQAVPTVDINAADDIMDAASNPVAQHFDQMVKEASVAQRAAAIASMHPNVALAPTKPIDPWFMHQPDTSTLSDPNSAMFAPQTVSPINSTTPPQNEDGFLTPKNDYAEAEAALIERLKAGKHLQAQIKNPHHKTIKTPSEVAADELAAKQLAAKQQAQAVTPPKNPDIVELANTNDLSVASVAHIANRNHSQQNNQEVVIKLH